MKVFSSDPYMQPDNIVYIDGRQFANLPDGGQVELTAEQTAHVEAIRAGEVPSYQQQIAARVMLKAGLAITQTEG